ncbi:hypothetical protein G3I76_45045 [Streptomyces sp. SID11233]|nr:hypothetical protein [Streptomyces sp. SID11233]
MGYGLRDAERVRAGAARARTAAGTWRAGPRTDRTVPPSPEAPVRPATLSVCDVPCRRHPATEFTYHGPREEATGYLVALRNAVRTAHGTGHTCVSLDEVG